MSFYYANDSRHICLASIEGMLWAYVMLFYVMLYSKVLKHSLEQFYATLTDALGAFHS